MKTSTFSLLVLSTSTALVAAIPAPTPAPTANIVSRSEDQAFIEGARAQLRPAWRPSDEAAPSAAAAGLAARGPVFRRAESSKFNYRRRAPSGYAVANNLPYGLGERDVAHAFGIAHRDHVPLPVAMRVKREASLAERDDDLEEDWDCEDWDEEDDGEDDVESSAESAPSSSEASPASSPAPASSAPQESASSSSSSQAVPSAYTAPENNGNNSPADGAQDQSNQSQNSLPDILTGNVASSAGQPDGTSDDSSVTQPDAQSGSWAAPASDSGSSKTSKKSKGKHGKSAKSTASNKPETLVNPTNLANGTLTVEEGCTRFHTIVAGEVCLGLLDWSRDLNLTLEQLYQYNPAINSECTNLEIGWGVCIGAKVQNATSAPVSSASATSHQLLRRRASQ